MTSLHAPERQPGESFDQYRERRAASHRAVKTVTHGVYLVGRHKASRAKTERRALVKAHGRRQAIKQIKADRFNAKDQAAIVS